MKNIIIREYLGSLTESEELDYIFPVLLEVMNFKIISTPKNTKGLAQYGKDIVAIGKDSDGVRKRFYFELKGGADKDVTTYNYSKRDGIRESIIEAKDRPYKDSSNPGFESLPVKIVLVHNGDIKANVKETFDGFIEQMFPSTIQKPKKGIWKLFSGKKQAPASYEFERWDIYQLTELFATHLFNEYLLTDAEALQHFKKVLVLINTPRNNFKDFFQLIDFIFEKAGNNADMGERKRLLFFETLKMVSFIVYHYSKDAGNLDAAKKCIPYTILRLWHWVLENHAEHDSKIIDHFNKNFSILFHVMQDYFAITLPIAKLKDGLWSPNGGRYEQVGYPVRALDYISYLIFYFTCQQQLEPDEAGLLDNQLTDLITVLDQNDGTTRPFFDNHSIPFCMVLNFLIQHGKVDDARVYLRNIMTSIQIAYNTHKRLPDGRNRMESVIRLVVTGQKSIYYSDETSHLFGILLEYAAVMNLKEEYTGFKTFLDRIKIDLAVFVPYDNDQLAEYLPDNGKSHELNVFSRMLYAEGQQAEITVEDDFKTFQDKTLKKPVFDYSYITNEVNMPHLLLLAHIYYRTPFFADSWRKIKIAAEVI